MNHYDTYKPSGIDWIGDVPSHWEVSRIKYLLSRSAAGVWGNDAKDDANDIICYRMADFDYAHGCLKFDNITYRNIEPSKVEGRKVKEGDLLIEKSGGGDLWPVGRVVRVNSNEEATCSNFIHSVSVDDSLASTNFLYYYFHQLYSKKINLLFFNQTTGIQNLQVPEYLSQDLFLPPLSEQEAIAAYLDKRCGEIDKVLSIQERRIELLREMKQSIITRAVTKGINPNAPMKDSGVEWIGEVPEHWEVQKLNQISRVVTDFVASGSFADLKKNVTYLDEPDYAMLVRTADLSGKGAEHAKVYVSKDSYSFLSNSNLHGGEIILPNIGASIGDVYIVPHGLYEHMTLGPNSIMLLTKYEDMYYYYYFSSRSGRESLELIGQAAAQNKFNKTELRQMKVLVPPLEEQQDIIHYIEMKTKALDAAITKAQREVELLRELKQATITEVVTGKRKVC